MKRRNVLSFVTLLSLALQVAAFGASKEESRAELNKIARDALAELYKAQPSARKQVESAAAYAAFNNFGMRILVAGGGSGKGIAIDNKTKAAAYMKMAEVQSGLGFGIKNRFCVCPYVSAI